MVLACDGGAVAGSLLAVKGDVTPVWGGGEGGSLKTSGFFGHLTCMSAAKQGDDSFLPLPSL